MTSSSSGGAGSTARRFAPSVPLWWLWFLAAVGAVVLVGPTGAVAVAEATQSPGVAFEDTRPLKLKPESPAETWTVKVCNISGVRAKPPTADVAPFEKGADPPRDLMKATVTSNDAPWEAGDCRDVVLQLEDSVTLASGSYSGVLTAVSTVGLARRVVTLEGPDEVAKAVAGKAASDTATLKATRDVPWGKAHLDDGGLLLLKPAAATEKLSVPSDCPEPGTSPTPKDSASTTATATPTGTSGTSATAKPELCPFVGNVINGTDVANVSVAGPLKNYGTKTKPAELPLELESADRAGTYAGSLHLAPTPGDPKDDVKLSVAVKDAWWCAAAALLIGALLSFLSQYGLRASWPKGRLRRRYRKFAAEYTTAVEEFNRNRAKGGDLPTEKWMPPTATDIDDVANAIELGVDRYRGSTVYWDTASEAYKELDRSLALVEDDLACLRDSTRLPATLKSLADGLKALATFLETQYHSPRAPRFVVPAAALLKGPAPKPETTPNKGETPPLAVGQALTISAAAKAATELIAAWRKLAERVLDYDPWWDRLAEKALVAARVESRWPEADLTKLKDAASFLAEAKQELLTVVDAAELAEFETAGDLRRTYANLAYLSGLYGGWPGEEEEELEADVRENAIREFELAGTVFSEQAEVAERRRAASQPPGHQLSHWLSEAEPLEAHGATAANLDDIEGILIASLALAFTVVVAVATGLAAFYFGEDTWGSWEDYITVIVVGVAATALVQSIVDAVSRVLPAVPKQLITGPTAAILKQPATPVAPVAATTNAS
jgi:hypothetical protein